MTNYILPVSETFIVECQLIATIVFWGLCILSLLLLIFRKFIISMCQSKIDYYEKVLNPRFKYVSYNLIPFIVIMLYFFMAFIIVALVGTKENACSLAWRGAGNLIELEIILITIAICALVYVLVNLSEHLVMMLFFKFKE